MIPQKLEITNFLSYRKPTAIDFNGIHLACISGPNGAGKSSILDAMTWALFGRSRSKSDDDIVNRLAAVQGQEAEVRFSFDLDSLTYRVIRQKKVGKTMTLEFQVSDSDGGWKSLSEGKLRATQASIEKLLSMNFDTFVNASFFLQGKADEFTTKTPNKRKEILAELLGVNEWDRYKDATAVKRKEAEAQLMMIDGRLGDIESELAERPEREAALASAREALTQVSERLTLHERLLNEHRRTDAAVKQHKQNLKNLGENLSRAQNSLDGLLATRVNRQSDKDAFQVLLDQAEIITREFAAWQEAEKTRQSWQEKADEYQAIEQKKLPLKLALEGELARLTQRRQELEEQQQRVLKMGEEKLLISRQIQEGQAQLDKLAAELVEAAKRETALHEARSRLNKLESERNLVIQEAGQLKARLKEVNNLRGEQLAVKKNLTAAESALKDLEKNLEQVTRDSERLAMVMAEHDTYKAEQPRLREEMNQTQEKIDRLREEEGGTCPLCDQPLSEQHRETVLSELMQDGKRMGDRFRANRENIEKLAIEIAELSGRIAGKDRLERERLAQQQRLAGAEARLAEIERQVTDWEATGRGRLEHLEQSLSDDSSLQVQRDLVVQLEGAPDDKARLDEERRRQERQLSNAEARLKEIMRMVAEWEGTDEDPGSGLANVLAEVANRLDSGEIAPETQKALAVLEQQAAQIGYDAIAHQEARRRYDELAPAQKNFQELQRAKAAIKPLNDTLADLDGQIAEQEKTIETLTMQLEEAELELENLSAGAGDIEAVESEVFRIREEENNAHRRLAIAQQNVDVLEDLRKQQEQISDERSQTTLLIQRLKVLEKACGREGVQALLIEHALPEVEDDANEMLARLTGGQMRVTFDTQKQLKSSDRVAETLDIQIVDSAGERPYENFSGGEQFRINFAIRLALSSILTKRAGARLQTLIIDEGFGSQDPVGRQRLIEGINAIQNEFRLILVITHVDELRDAFPARIEVAKETGGSMISII